MRSSKLWLLLGAVVLFSACAVRADEDDDDDCEDDGVCDEEVEFEESCGNESGDDGDGDRRKRSLGYGNFRSYGGYDHGYPRFGGFDKFRGYGNYGNFGKYDGFGYGRAYVSKPSFTRSFREGKWRMDNQHMVKNYYKKGTYETAKKYFIALPFVKIIPVKTTTSIDYVGQLRAYSGSHGGYSVRLCEHCHKGSAQIEFQAKGKPYHNVVRRFNFLPHTKRSRTEYGEPRIVPAGKAYVSHGDQGHW